MSGTQESQVTEPVQQPPLPIYMDARGTFAAAFLFGKGLEIGALHQPLAVPPHVDVSYVDRMTAEELRSEYPELADWNLTRVDVIDDGEKLETIARESQDFIIANHFLEHTENPIGTIETHLEKLKPGGVLFYAVPDKRFTFDFRRPLTPIEHMVADYQEGPGRSRREHFDEWTRLVIDEESAGSADQAASREWSARRARELEAAAYSIHMHVWTQAEFLTLILDCRRRFGDTFDIETAARQGIEFIVVLRKMGPLPAVPATAHPAPQPRPRLRSRIKAKLGRATTRLRRG
jgi:SAM-dependent methyltransferase